MMHLIVLIGRFPVIHCGSSRDARAISASQRSRRLSLPEIVSLTSAGSEVPRSIIGDRTPDRKATLGSGSSREITREIIARLEGATVSAIAAADVINYPASLLR